MPPPMGIRGGGGLGGGGSRLGLPSGWRTVYIQTLRNISLFSLYSRPIFRRPSQLRWGASNSLNIQGVEGGREETLAFRASQVT